MPTLGPTLRQTSEEVKVPPVAANTQTGAFSATGSMTTVRYSHTATLLPNGKVLVAGGSNPSVAYLASAELYDPATGAFGATGSMATARRFHTATLLPNGKVLVVGGDGTSALLASAELYDPTTGAFSATGPMTTVRAHYTATLLPDGRVLVAGGDNSSEALASAELYDPETGIFSATGSMTTPRYDHTATLLPNGKVLVAGGCPDICLGSRLLASAELYDPMTGTFSAAGSMITPRSEYTATLLPNGKVLVAGGSGNVSSTPSVAAGAARTVTVTLLPNGKVLVAEGAAGNPGLPPVSVPLASAELYDPTTGAFSVTGLMITPRSEYTATLLPDGKVLVAGGNNNSALASAELYDPTTGAFSASGLMITPRSEYTATLLPDGKVLIAGGHENTRDLASAELYIRVPTDKDECNNNGWMTLSGADGSPFKSQGDCAQFVNTRK